MSGLHCRGCDCSLCLPGHRAQMTRVYRDEQPGPPLMPEWRLKWTSARRERRREQCREAHRKWKASIASMSPTNPEGQP